MKKIFLIITCIFFTVQFTRADSTVLVSSDKDDSKKNPMDILMSRILNIKNLQEDDYLIDFNAKPLQPGDQYLDDNNYQYGGSNFFTNAIDKTNLVSSIKAFNDAHGDRPITTQNPTNDQVKLFVVTGRYFLGYHETFAPRPEEEQNADINKALNGIAEKLNKSEGVQNGEKFQKDWISILSKKFQDISGANVKVIVFFYVEAVLYDMNNRVTVINVENQGVAQSFKTESTLTKKNIGFIWQKSLDVFEWAKISNLIKGGNNYFSNTLIRNPVSGLQNPSGLKDCIDEIKRQFEANLDLTNPYVVRNIIQFMQKGDWDSFTSQQKGVFLAAIDNAFNNDCDKLDLLYEKMPKYVMADMPDATLWKHLKAILECFVDENGSNEEEAVINILKGFKDRQYEYKNLYDNKSIVEKLYNKVDGDNKVTVLTILQDLMRVNNSKIDPKAFIFLGKANDLKYSKSTYTQRPLVYQQPYLLSSLSGFESGNNINLDCFIGNPNLDGTAQLGKQISQFLHLHPLDPVRVHQESIDNYEVRPAVMAYWLGAKQNREESLGKIETATNALGIFSAGRVLFIKNTPKLLKIIAIVEVGKAAVDLAIKKQPIKDELAKTEEGRWLLRNWAIISISADILTFSTDIIHGIAQCRKLKTTLVTQGETDAANALDEMGEVAENADITVVRVVGKTGLLARITNYPELSKLVNRLDETADANFLGKIDDMITNDPDKLDALNTFYNPSSQQLSLPNDAPIINGEKVLGDFNSTKLIDGISETVYYNKYGFPNFQRFSPGNDYIYISSNLTGGTSDFTNANRRMQTIFKDQPDKFIWTSPNTWFQIKQIDGSLKKYTWHHVQDGRTIFPIPSLVNNIPTGFKHTGGNSLINKGLQDIFN